jgi:hypothetical protein
MDRVWVAIDAAVQAALEEKGVAKDPPVTDDDWMWLAASITDQVCAGIPKDVYSAFREALAKAQPARGRRRWGRRHA